MKIRFKDLKPGMKVKLKSNLEDGRQYGRAYFVKEHMLKGIVVTIAQLHYDRSFLIKEGSHPFVYWYTPKMVKYVRT